MKVLLLLFSIISVVTSYAQEGVKWESGSLQEALDKAAANKKHHSLVFLDCYTSWCAPCKMMSENVFTQKAAGDYFNKRFVNIMIDMESGEGIDIARKYAIKAYPTFLILNPDGSEVGRVIGGGKLDEVIKKIDKALNPADSPDSLLEKYNQSGSMADAYIYLHAMEELRKEEEIAEFVKVNYQKIPIKDLYSTRFWRYILKAISLSDTAVLEKVITNKATFDIYFGKEKTDSDIAIVLNEELFSYIVYQKEIPIQNIERACELYDLMARNTDLLEQLVIRVSKAVAAKKIDEIKKTFDGRYVGYSYSPTQMRKVQHLFFGIPGVTDSDRIKFLKGYKTFLESQINGVDKELEKYGDVANR